MLRILALCLAGAALAPSAWAQLDLPARRPANVRPSSGVVPSDVPVRGDLAPRPSELDGIVLDLPVPPAGVGPVSAADASPRTAAVAGVFAGLAAERDANGARAKSALVELGAMPSEALVAARDILVAPDTVKGRAQVVPIVVAARALLRFGTREDRVFVARRLERTLPSNAYGLLLDELVAGDPITADRAYVAGLLEHPSNGMRSAAFRVLAEAPRADDLPLLVARLNSRRPETRFLALDLAAALEGEAAERVLASALGDHTATVAANAAKHLAVRADARVTAQLRAIAFAEGRSGVDRAGAYALLALIEREVANRDAYLFDDDVPKLLVGLRDTSPIVAGASAAALARVGFRTEARESPPWLDRDVPFTLIRYATGDTFHADFSSLQAPGLDQLALLTGESFGRNGYAWQGWWADNFANFRARRAVLDVVAGDEGELVFELQASNGEVLRLIGPGRASREVAGEATRVFLTQAEAAHLTGVLEGQGVFRAERLPNVPGHGATQVDRMRVAIAGGEKRFSRVVGVELPWFERIGAAARELARSNRWQQLFDRGRYATQLDAWVAERDAWASVTSPLEHARRTKDAVLARLGYAQAAERPELCALAVELYADEAVVQFEDFTRWFDLLCDEGGAGTDVGGIDATVRVFATHALRALRAADREAGPVEIRGELLAKLLVERFGQDAAAFVREALEAAGPAVRGRACADSNPHLRAIAAGSLAASGDVGAVEGLIALLDDPDPEVEIATLDAIGAHRIVSARSAVAERAGFEPAEDGTAPFVPVRVRAAALRALAAMAETTGDATVRDYCLLALAEDEPLLHEAAVDALVALELPESATILASLFARGQASSFFPATRRGLLALGDAARSEVLRLTSAPLRATRRDAALLLAEQGRAEAASSLIMLLTEDPRDARVGEELAVLSCVDLRDEPDAVVAWWDWWDVVVHDDALAWLCAAAERAGRRAPSPEALRGAGTEAGAGFLLEVARPGDSVLAERARRELERLLDGSVSAPPIAESELRVWQAELRERIRRTYVR